MKLYIPARTAIVLAPFEFAVKYKEEVKLPQYDPEDADFKNFIPNLKTSKVAVVEEQKLEQNEAPTKEDKAQEKAEEKAEQQSKSKPEKKKLIDLMEDLTHA